MFDTEKDLLTQIRLGEDSRLELKTIEFRGVGLLVRIQTVWRTS